MGAKLDLPWREGFRRHAPRAAAALLRWSSFTAPSPSAGLLPRTMEPAKIDPPGHHRTGVHGQASVIRKPRRNEQHIGKRQVVETVEGVTRGIVSMAEESHADDRIDRAIAEHRARALQQLDGLAANALGDLFRSRRRAPSTSSHDLAHRLARDLTALGMAVHDSSRSATTGGVWLAPCLDDPGVIVVWTQHEASAAVLGPRLHRDLQVTMNFDLCEVLRILGYAVKPYGSGEAHVVTAPR